MRLTFSERYIVVLNFLLIAGCAHFAARSVNDLLSRRLIVVPPAPRIAFVLPPPALSRQAYDLIVQRDIFNAVGAQAVVVPPPPPVPLDLHLKLVGTSHLTHAKPFAIIEDDNSHIQALYQLGDLIPYAGVLVGVEKSQVVINHDGHIVTLKIPEEPLTSEVLAPALVPIRPARRQVARRPELDRYIRRTGPNDFVVYRKAVESDLQNLRPLLTQIRALPNFENGKTDGYTLSEIQPDSLFDEMGLREGDIVSAVNGQELSDPTQALLMLNSLRDQSSISVTVRRSGQPLQYNFSIR